MINQAGAVQGRSSDGGRTRHAAPLYLASSSPRRRKVLEQIGVPFRVHVTDVEEVELASDPMETVRINALTKVQATRSFFPDAPIIAADTVLEFKGRCLCKPVSLDDARRLFASLSGNSHTVLTGVALWAAGNGGEPTIKVEASIVRFRRLETKDVDAYIRAVNPLDKAGGYDIDQSAEMIIDSFEGSRTNVMGLPIEVVTPWLNQQGLL